MANRFKTGIQNLFIQKNWHWFSLSGVLMVIGGVLTLFNPFLLSATIGFIISLSFLCVGIASVVAAFAIRANKLACWGLSLLGGLWIVIAWYLFAHPAEATGLVSLLIAVLILFLGVVNVIAGIAHRPRLGWTFTSLSGVVQVIMAIMLVVNSSRFATFDISILFGLSVLFTGTAALFIGMGLRKSATVQ